MKYPHTRFVASLAIAALGAVGLSTASAQTDGRPTVITPPAVKDGSNWSRAPFPAQRQFDDTKGPDAKAIDETGANNPVAKIEPPAPETRIAILQPAPAPGIAADPGLLPTGRTTIIVAQPLEVTTYTPTIRAATFATREQMLDDIEARVKNTESAIASVHGSLSADARTQFNAAADEMKAKAKALRKTLKDARKATDAQWETTRTQLAADYEAFAAAAARIDAATGAAAR